MSLLWGKQFVCMNITIKHVLGVHTIQSAFRHFEISHQLSFIQRLELET